MEENIPIEKGAKTELMNLLLDFYGELLPDGQREAMEYFYSDDLSLGEIAQIVGITRQGVRDRIVKGEHTLRTTEQRLGLVNRFSEQQRTLTRIRAELEALRPRCGDRIDGIIGMVEELL